MTFRAYAAQKAGAELEPFEFDPGELGNDEVEIDVTYCGVCHSDLSLLNNDWGNAEYPLVPGHEVIGTVTAVGEQVTSVRPGQTVGLGWQARSCMTCEWCLRGDQNLCPNGTATIVGRHGGFADKVRGQAQWAIPLPEGCDAATAGPLFCGGITVFNPIIQCGVLATHRVGVVGIGGLGHMALQFLNAWGCEVTAFSTSPDKETEARELGAHHFVDSRDESALKKCRGSFDLILITVNVELPWHRYIAALRPRGRLHFVGAAPSVSSKVFALIGGQKSISGSPIGSMATIADMLEFCTRHEIAPMTELFPMSKVNGAMAHLREGKPRYRIVLENDFE